jgi:mRNA interferase MazF
MGYERGAVVKGPDVFGPHSHRPYVCLSDETHPFSDEEAMYAAVTTTRLSRAVPLAAADFESGGLPEESYVNPWTVTSLRHADVDERHGQLTDDTTRAIVVETAGFLGVQPARN